MVPVPNQKPPNFKVVIEWYTLNFYHYDSVLAQFLENYWCYEVEFGVKMTARPFSTIHILSDMTRKAHQLSG